MYFLKKISDVWNTDEAGGNGKSKYVEISTINICADLFAASLKAKVFHIIKGESKGISYYVLFLFFSLFLILFAWQSERSN